MQGDKGPAGTAQQTGRKMRRGALKTVNERKGDRVGWTEKRGSYREDGKGKHEMGVRETQRRLLLTVLGTAEILKRHAEDREPQRESTDTSLEAKKAKRGPGYQGINNQKKMCPKTSKLNKKKEGQRDKKRDST